MDSIFKTINLPTIPVNLLSTLKIFFEKGTLENKTLFEQLYIDKWFSYNLPQMDLTAEAIMARYKIRFMASVIGDDSGTPTRPNEGFKTLSGEIPRVGHKFPMKAKTLRKLLSIVENPRYSDQQKFNEVYKMLIGDVKEAYLGCKDTLDQMVLQALSNKGVASFTSLNNPDGRLYKIDYNMPKENILTAPKEWIDANDESVNPFQELQKIVLSALQRGIVFGEMLMDPTLYSWFISCSAVRKAVLGIDKGSGVVDDARLQNVLAQYNLPPITKIIKGNAVQKNGKRESSIINPWNSNMIVLKPAGIIGEIQPAFEDSSIIPEEKVTYIDAGNGIRVSKWTEGESTGKAAAEFTQASWRALPFITAIDGIFSYQVRNK